MAATTAIRGLAGTAMAERSTAAMQAAQFEGIPVIQEGSRTAEASEAPITAAASTAAARGLAATVKLQSDRSP
jgi:hypothetical protein